MSTLDAIDREIVLATQAGLPLVPEPYAAIGAKVGISADEVIARLAAMAETGALRRIAAVPNHYALGWTANGMSVWDVDDDAVDELGARIGAMASVSHCYRRPRHLPLWPYNLFAMVHGSSRREVCAHVDAIAAELGVAVRSHDVLFSTRILKKTGLRLVRERGA